MELACEWAAPGGCEITQGPDEVFALDPSSLVLSTNLDN